MLKREKNIQLLIANGYDDSLVSELPKLFIDDYFEKGKEMISEALDIFIDSVQRGDIIPDENNNVAFASIEKMDENDYNPKASDGIFYSFKFHITEEFMHIIGRRPLRNILVNNGVLEYDSGYRKFHKEIVGSPKEYYDLCEIATRYYNTNNWLRTYIKSTDLLTILSSKGFSEESIAIIYGEYGFGPRYPKVIPNDGVYINYDAIMSLGNSQDCVLTKNI